MIQTIDFFRSFISDPFTFGKIAAIHALSDCHAMGARAKTALALAVMQFAANEAMTERTLIDMLSGASDVLEEEGCELAGGHTCEGVEQALGFSVTGFIDDPNKLLRKRGGIVGDKIVLTKPIGTGALFAADMRAKCHGHAVEEALRSMTTSNGYASRIAMDMIEHRMNSDSVNGAGEGLNAYDRGIHACTDVTGFGLAGHLLEMLVANDGIKHGSAGAEFNSIAASIDLNAVPFLRGALEASNNDITSSLYRENFRSRRAVSNHADAARTHPIKYPLLFDPQTAGGLLFFISPDICDEFIRKLTNDGTRGAELPATVIGELVDYNAQQYDNLVCDIDGSCTPTAGRIHIHY